MTWTGANVVVSILARIAHLTAWLTLSLPFVLLTVACYLLFGYELALRGGRIVLAAGDTPPGSWRVVYVPPLHRYDLRQDRAAAYFDTNYTPGWDDPDDPEEHQRNADAVWAYERTLQEEWRLSTKGLIHSRAYSDPRVARLIVDWVRQHVGTC